MEDLRELLDTVLNELLAAKLSNVYERSTDFDTDRALVYENINKYRTRAGLVSVSDPLTFVEDEDDD